MVTDDNLSSTAPAATATQLATQEPSVTAGPIEQSPVPSATVPLSDEVVEPTAVVPEQEIVDPRSELLDGYLQGLAGSGRFMGSVLVAHDGNVLLNEGYGLSDIQSDRPNTPDTQFRIASISKHFTAAAILKLQEQGSLDVSDMVSQYVPDYPNGDQISIHQLLTNSSGIPNYEELPNLQQQVQTPISLDDLINTFSSQPLVHPPGQRFTYSSSGYVLLTKIIEEVSGESYAEYVRSELLLPASLLDSGYDFLSPDLTFPATGYRLTPGGPQPAVVPDTSWLSGAGALYSTIEDMYRWEQALTGVRVLNPESVEAMFTPWVNAGNGESYGYGWQIGQIFGRPSAFHGGAIFGVGSFLLLFPEEDATIIVLGNGTQLAPRQIATDLAQILFTE